MYKVEIQDNSDKTGFWVYIVNQETKKEFMFRYRELTAYEMRAIDKVKSEEKDQAERLIKFMGR